MGVYFQTASNYAKLLDEAMEIYDKAAGTQFSTNPWEFTETALSHRNKFPDPEYMEALNECWARSVGRGGKGTSVQSDKKLGWLVDSKPRVVLFWLQNLQRQCPAY